MALFLKLYWKHIVVIAAIVLSGYTAYNWAYQRGYAESSATYTKIIEKHNTEVADKIKDLTASSIKLAADLEAAKETDRQEFEQILKVAKQKPATVIKEGKCVPSQTFIEQFNKSKDKVNK